MPGLTEAEREEGGGRWTSFTPHEHDLRTQKHVRDYDSYPDSKPPKPPRPPSHPTDASQGSRGPNVKTLLANQQAAGRPRKAKSTAVAHHVIRKEGPNWVLLAGGAIVTAIGVMIVRKRKPPVCEEKIIEKAVPTPGKDHAQQSGLSFATTRRESMGSRTSEPSTASPYSGEAYMIPHNVGRSQSDGSRVGSDWGDDECIPLSPPATYYHSHFSKGSNHSSRTVITPTSPPGSYRGADTSATEGHDLPLSPVSRSGYSSRRDMVHRLRQQLKSRDETIHDMLAQITDQERTISLHQAHCRDLEGRLDAAGKTLFESNREIQRLRKAVADYMAGDAPGSGNWDFPPMPDRGRLASLEGDNDYAEDTIDVFLSDQRESGHEVEELVSKVKRLTEELKVQVSLKRNLERIANARLMEHEILEERVQQLEEELAEAKRREIEKDILLEAFEAHQDYQAVAVDDLKRKLEINADYKGNQTPSLIGRRSLSGGFATFFSKHALKGKKEESTSCKADASKTPSGSHVRSNSGLFEKISGQSSKNLSTVRSWFKPDESSSTGDASDDSDGELPNLAVGEKLLMKLREEVENLSFALAEHSQLIAEKRMETSRLVDELQKHSAIINDLQMKMDENGEGKSETEEQDWEQLSRQLSFSHGGTSAAQVQELSHKLEQIAKQQRVEEEMSELAKHQVKIRELNDRVEKLLNKFKDLQNRTTNDDPTTQQQASHVTAVGEELKAQLKLQEEQALKTSKDVARLSASFQLSSPYVPRSEKEALRKKLQRGSSESLSPGNERLEPLNLFLTLAPIKVRFATGSEEKAKESGDSLFDRTIAVSTAELAGPQGEGGLGSQIQEQYVYRPGFSGPSNRKSRRGFPIGSGSGREALAGAKRRAARGNKKGSSSEDREVVRSDSNRWTSKPRYQLASSDANRSLFESYPESSARQNFVETDEDVSSLDVRRSELGDWMKEEIDALSAPETESMHMDSVQCGRRDSPKSRRQSTSSFYSVEESLVMRMGSPTVADGEMFYREADGEKTKFIFDMEKGNEVYVIDPDECVQDGFRIKEAAPMAPVTQLMASLDLKPDSPATSVQEECSFGSSISGLSTEMLNAIRDSPKGGRGEKSSGSYSDCSNSLDSSLDVILDTALADMVRMVSTPSTPADTPESSFMSSQSETKSDAIYQV